MNRSRSMPSGPALAAVFCALFLLAGLLSYSRSGAGSLGFMRKDGNVIRSDNGGDVWHETASDPSHYRDKDGDLETIEVNEPRDITNDKAVLVRRPVAVEETGEEQDKDNQGDDEGEIFEQEVEEEETIGAPTTSTEAPLITNVPYEPTDEDCKTSRRKQQVGVYNKGPRFQYVHIPKTGGTSIQMEIAQWVFHTDVKIVLLKNDAPKIKGTSFACPPAAKEASYLIGHRGFGYCREIETAKRGLFTFATFRSSASRIVSLFDYNMGREEIRSLRVFGTTSLNRWIKVFNSTPEIEEGERLLRFHGSQQVRFMCGYECIGPNAWHNHTMTLPFMMERAIANLKKLDVIGLTEHLNDVLPQLKFHIPYLPPGFKGWPVENHTSKRMRSVLDEESTAILAEWAKPDQDLYNVAEALYKKKDAIARYCMKRGSKVWR